jgi:hypothetical protein
MLDNRRHWRNRIGLGGRLDVVGPLTMTQRDDRPHKIMTPEEYAALRIIGWHRVCKDADGFGGIGIQYEPAIEQEPKP